MPELQVASVSCRLPNQGNPQDRGGERQVYLLNYTFILGLCFKIQSFVTICRGNISRLYQGNNRWANQSSKHLKRTKNGNTKIYFPTFHRLPTCIMVKSVTITIQIRILSYTYNWAANLTFFKSMPYCKSIILLLKITVVEKNKYM